jgi:hypothetical protein
VIYLSACSKTIDEQVQDAEIHFLKEYYNEERVVLADARELIKKSKQLLILKSGNESYAAESLYYCFSFSDFECRLQYADDTIHTTEFEYTAVPYTDNIHVTYNGDMPAQHLSFYVGEPREMHSVGYSKITAIKMSQEGTLSFLADNCYAPEMLLIAFLKPKNHRLLKKYVWVIKCPLAMPIPNR